MNDRFLKALRGENHETPPIWIMRQAGRYLPEYRMLRESVSLWELFHNSRLATEVTLMPIDRFGFDASIVFSDILVVAEVFGFNLQFPDGKGPQIFPQLISAAEIANLKPRPVEEVLFYVKETILALKKTLQVPLIGFCGGPFTVASYMMEDAKKWLYNDPVSFHQLLSKLTDASIAYLKMQEAAGVNAIQIFDSWAGDLSAPDFASCSLYYLKKIKDALTVPVIFFCRGSSYRASALASAHPAAVSVDWQRPIHEIAAELPPSVALQGNLDPSILQGAPDMLIKAAQEILTSMRGHRGYIFNLGHGILPDTPLANVQRLVDLVRSTS